MKTARKRQTLTLTFNKKQTFGENKELAVTWKTAVKALLNGAMIGSIQGKTYCMLYSVLPLWHLYELKHIVCHILSGAIIASLQGVAYCMLC